jgi:hypothetical protein
MRKWMAMLLGVAAVAATMAVAGSAVEPVTCTVTNVRGEAAASVSAGQIYRGSTLTFTNCQLYAGTSATGAVQTLTNVLVEISVGNLSTNVEYTASSTNAAAGTWNATITVPDLASWTMEVRLTDENTNQYIYPAKTFVSETSMFD